MTLSDAQLTWEKKSTVRNLPHCYLEEGQGYFYPCYRQPLSIHPNVIALGEDAIQYVLVQSLYKYMNDIAVIETRVVNQGLLNATGNLLPVTLNASQKLALYTIMVDEAYHAYLAYDAMQQITTHTGIDPLPFPDTIEIELALNITKSKLPGRYHNTIDLIAICLAENTLTKDIVGMVDQTDTHPFFQTLIKNHYHDEKRHTGFFFALLKDFWHKLPEDYQTHIGTCLPEFITHYLGVEAQFAFDKEILLSLGINRDEADNILEDVYGAFELTPYHPMLKNILMMLNKTGILEHEVVASAFHNKNWLLVEKVEV